MVRIVEEKSGNKSLPNKTTAFGFRQGFYLKEAMIRQLLASVPGADFADDQVKEGLVRNFLQGDALAPK